MSGKLLARKYIYGVAEGIQYPSQGSKTRKINER